MSTKTLQGRQRPVAVPALGNYTILNSEASTGLLDLFDTQKVETAVINSATLVDYSPLQAIANASSTSPVIFHCPADVNKMQWTIPGLCRLTGKFRIVKKDGTAIVAEAKVAPIDFSPVALFKDLQITLNGVLLSDSFGSNQAYSEILSLLCSFNDKALQQNFAGYLPFPDTASKCDLTTDDNTGFKARKELFAESAERSFDIAIPHDLFKSSRLFHPSMDLRLRFELNNDAFMLHQATTDTEQYRLQLTDLKLHLYKIQLHPTVASSIFEKLNKGQQMHHSYLSTTLKTFPLAVGGSSFYIPEVLISKPSSILICMLEQSRYFGSRKQTPFKFSRFDLRQLNLFLNNNKMLDASFDFSSSDEDNTMREAYRQFQAEMAFEDVNTVNAISFESFKSSNFLMYRDLSVSKSVNYMPELLTLSGSISLELLFNSPLSSAITVLVFATYHTSLSIDKEMQSTVQKF